MKRRLVKQGLSTMMISLPSKWVKQNRLDKGSEVELQEENNKLTITSEKKAELKTKKIEMSGFGLLTNRAVLAAYIKGYDELELVFEKQEDMKLLRQQVVDELLGYEIIKKTDKSILIKNIAELESKGIDDIINRIFSILDAMLDELIENSQSKQLADSLNAMDASVNRLANLSLRILNTEGHSTPEKTVPFYGLVSQLEEIGDIIKAIGKFKKESIKKNISQLKEIKKFLASFQETTVAFEKNKAATIAQNYESLKKKIAKNELESELIQLINHIIKLNNYLLVSLV